MNTIVAVFLLAIATCNCIPVQKHDWNDWEQSAENNFNIAQQPIDTKHEQDKMKFNADFKPLAWRLDTTRSSETSDDSSNDKLTQKWNPAARLTEQMDKVENEATINWPRNSNDQQQQHFNDAARLTEQMDKVENEATINWPRNNNNQQQQHFNDAVQSTSTMIPVYSNEQEYFHDHVHGHDAHEDKLIRINYKHHTDMSNENEFQHGRKMVRNEMRSRHHKQIVNNNNDDQMVNTINRNM